jgi:hypothetical protein
LPAGAWRDKDNPNVFHYGPTPPGTYADGAGILRGLPGEGAWIYTPGQGSRPGPTAAPIPPINNTPKSSDQIVLAPLPAGAWRDKDNPNVFHYGPTPPGTYADGAGILRGLPGEGAWIYTPGQGSRPGQGTTPVPISSPGPTASSAE